VISPVSIKRSGRSSRKRRNGHDARIEAVSNCLFSRCVRCVGCKPGYRWTLRNDKLSMRSVVRTTRGCRPNCNPPHMARRYFVCRMSGPIRTLRYVQGGFRNYHAWRTSALGQTGVLLYPYGTAKGDQNIYMGCMGNFFSSCTCIVSFYRLQCKNEIKVQFGSKPEGLSLVCLFGCVLAVGYTFSAYRSTLIRCFLCPGLSHSHLVAATA